MLSRCRKGVHALIMSRYVPLQGWVAIYLVLMFLQALLRFGASVCCLPTKRGFSRCSRISSSVGHVPQVDKQRAAVTANTQLRLLKFEHTQTCPCSTRDTTLSHSQLVAPNSRIGWEGGSHKHDPPRNREPTSALRDPAFCFPVDLRSQGFGTPIDFVLMNRARLHRTSPHCTTR